MSEITCPICKKPQGESRHTCYFCAAELVGIALVPDDDPVQAVLDAMEDPPPMTDHAGSLPDASIVLLIRDMRNALSKANADADTAAGMASVLLARLSAWRQVTMHVCDLLWEIAKTVADVTEDHPWDGKMGSSWRDADVEIFETIRAMMMAAESGED